MSTTPLGAQPSGHPAAGPVDLLIIGGGPVGLATALYAVRRGLAPVVLEPRMGVIDKACGEGLMPGGLQALLELGVDAPGHDLRGIRYLAGTRGAEADFAAGLGRGIRRTTLHAALLEAVASAGVSVLPLAAAGLSQQDTGVAVETEAGGARGPTVHARWVVGADGLHSPTRRYLRLDHGPESGPQRVGTAARYGLRQHYRTPPWGDHVEVHWADRGEAYVTPVAEDLVGVAVLSRRRPNPKDHLAEFPELRGRLAGAPVVTSLRGAGPLHQRTTRRVAGRVLLAGDASGYVDALTGEGISLGLAHARAAVAAIAASDPESYERSWRAATRRYALLTRSLVQLSRPAWGRRLVVPAAAALPAVFRVAVNELARPIGPGT